MRRQVIGSDTMEQLEAIGDWGSCVAPRSSFVKQSTKFKPVNRRRIRDTTTKFSTTGIVLMFWGLGYATHQLGCQKGNTTNLSISWSTCCTKQDILLYKEEQKMTPQDQQQPAGVTLPLLHTHPQQQHNHPLNTLPQRNKEQITHDTATSPGRCACSSASAASCRLVPQHT